MTVRRFRLPASGSAAVSPAFQTYTHTNSVRRPLPTSDATALATQAYTPDAADHSVAGDAHHLQLVSDPWNEGDVIGGAIKYAVQALEAHANNNLQIRIWLGVYSNDGLTLLATLLGLTQEGTELGTALANRFYSGVTSKYQAGGGERLVAEFSLYGTPGGGSGVQGHNGSMRWGSDGTSGDLPENDTETGTTFNPWLEIEWETLRETRAGRKPGPWGPYNPSAVARPFRPILRGCKALVPLWELGGDRSRDLIVPGRDARFTSFGGSALPVWRGTHVGRSVLLDTTGSNRPELSFAESKIISFGAAEPYTVAFYFRPLSLVDSNGGLFRSGSTSEGNYLMGLQSSNGLLWGRHNGNGVGEGQGFPKLAINRDYLVVRTWNGSTVTDYVGGRPFTTVNDSTGTAWDIYQLGISFSESFDAQWHWFGAWGRALSPVEILRLHRDPFGLFRRARQA